VNVSTGIYPKSGASKLGGRVQALAFESSGQMLWAGNDKVTSNLIMHLRSLYWYAKSSKEVFKFSLKNNINFF
jgi:hypothetical protein